MANPVKVAHGAVSGLPAQGGTAAGNAGEGLFVVAGVVVAAAGFKLNHHLGAWWWRVLIGTVGLCVLAAAMSRTKAAPIVKGVAWLTFLSACIYAVPAFKGAPAFTSKYVGKAKGGSNNPGGSPSEGTARTGTKKTNPNVGGSPTEGTKRK